MRPLVAHCHLGLGKLYRRTGKREQAQEHLTTATTMYREMDMRFWLEQAERCTGRRGMMTRVGWALVLTLAPPRRAARRPGAAGGEGLPDWIASGRRPRLHLAVFVPQFPGRAP